MSLYKINRSRSLSFVGKFKFDYTVEFNGSTARWTQFGSSRGAYIDFRRGLEFTGLCVVSNNSADDNGYIEHPFGPGGDFGNPAPDIGGNYEVRLNYFLKGGLTSERRYFTLSIQPPPNSNDELLNDPGDELAGGFTSLRRIVRGSIEGFIFDNEPLDEYVEVSEYYPSEVQKRPGNCPGSLDEFWVDKKLDQNTVRQWPKYTSLRWFETPNPKGKRTLGIYVKHQSGNISSVHFASYDASPSLFTEYNQYKAFNAWSGDTTGNSGYCTISSNLEYKDQIIIPARTDRVTVDLDKFSISPADRGYNRQATTIVPNSSPVRNVSFESIIKDWKQNHSDELTAYLVGFNSDGVNKVSDQDGNEYPAPTYQIVNTKSGVISASQTYLRYDSPTITAREEGQLDSKSFPKFDNTQKWIFGMLDGSKTKALNKELFDDLESPPKNYDFPDKYVTRLSLAGGFYCVNINQISQDLTIDESDLPSGYMSIPIPLRGWKFNALSLYQEPELIVPGIGNVRDFTVEDNIPKYYGNFNLSGYRYLDLQLKSKDQNTQTASFQIDETSRGPKTLGGNFSINEKKWEISTSSNVFENIRIDLCNPDNKIEKVDNQDSPYPRLNTYTTSIPQFRETFAYLSKENSPKDTFITTKKNKTSSDALWIDAQEAKTIASSGIVYLLNEADSVIDYFEVDSSKLPKSGTATTNLIFGKPRVRNGKVKLAKYWNGSEANSNPEYRKTLWITIPKNLLTSGRSINELLDADKDGKFPKEFQIYDFDPGYEDVISNITKLSKNYLDNSNNIFVNKVSIYENGEIVPYNAVILTTTDTKVSRKYKIVQYQNDVQGDNSYFVIENNSTSDKNLIFYPDKTEVSLGFYNPDSDDTFRTGYVKFEKINKVGNIYEARIEYFKQKLSDEPIFEGIPIYESGLKYNYFSNSSPVISLEPPKLVEYVFPVDTAIRLKLDTSSSPSGNEVNAIDDYPEDEASNQLYYGVSRVAKIAVDSNNIEVGEMKLIRDNSLSNFVIAGNKNTFTLKTKFIVAENSSTGVPTETEYFTRRFWQQSTDARDEEEGDIEWQHTTSATLDNWTLFPRTISEFCDEINAKDVYVAPRWLDPSNSASEIIRHPGWKATKVNKALTGGVEPIWKEALLDPDYLNSDSGYASWIYGGGLLALPSGKNSGSGTSYYSAIDVSFNQIKNILAQTIFHRINGDFPPGKPDLFGNTSLLNEDGTKQESTLHLRGGLIARGPGHGLILPPAESTPDQLRQATLIQRTSGDPINAGSDETDAEGFYETGSPYGKTNLSHVIQVSESAEFPNPDELTSSSRNISQGKRERASFKQGEGASAVSLSTVESGFEHSFVIAYEIPTENAKNEGRTGIISTGSFYDSNFEKYSLGFGALPNDSGVGVSMKGFMPFLVSTEVTDNISTNTHCFVLTEKNSDITTNKTSNYSSLIASNTRVLSRNAWAPFIEGQSAENLNFDTESIIFNKTKLNSYVISDFNPEIYMVGYADPGSIIFQSTHLSIAGVQAPSKSKTLLIDGAIPSDQKSFNLFDQYTSSSNAYESHPVVIQLLSRELLVCYLKDENKKKVLFKTVSNDKILETAPNVLLDLEKIAGVTLDKKFDIYGLTSTYGEVGETIHFIFYSNGNIYYFNNDFSSSDRSEIKIDKIHLVKGEIGDELSTALQNKGVLVTYFNATDTFNLTTTYGKKVPKHRSGITIAKKEDYYYKIIVTFDTGKCNLQSVLFEPFKKIEYVREFKIECVAKGTNKRPRAKISANPTSGNSALNVQFSSQGSTDPENASLTYRWNFDDGTTSNLANPSHLFYNSTSENVSYNVSLIVVDEKGLSSVPASVTITVFPESDVDPNGNQKPTAKFSASPTDGLRDLTVNFVDQSTSVSTTQVINKWVWDFYGDGQTVEKTTNDTFPFIYTRTGTFTPKLYVVDSANIQSATFTGPAITVRDQENQNSPPVADFSYEQVTFTRSFEVRFTDLSKENIVSWEWSFGDTKSDTIQNPINIYGSKGIYNVTLTVFDKFGAQDSITKTIDVIETTLDLPKPDFSFVQRPKSFTVDFTNLSTGNGTLTYKWYFNDQDLNITSSFRDPSFTYALAATYGVKLEVTDQNGTAFITKQVTVSEPVNLPPSIDQLSGQQINNNPLVAKFSNSSSDTDGFISEWTWNYGDNNQETFSDISLSNPEHTYSIPGEYRVTLRVTDDGLSDGTKKLSTEKSFIQTILPAPVNEAPKALFVASTNNVFAPVNITFTDLSTDQDGKIIKWKWYLDGVLIDEYSDLNYKKTISLNFTKSGLFQVSLVVEDNQNTLSLPYIVTINIINQRPVPRITATPNPQFNNLLSGSSIIFDGSLSSDPDGTISKYSWNFGLAGSYQNQSETIKYTRPGTYTATLTVTDNLGLSATSSPFIFNIQNSAPKAVITHQNSSLSVKAPAQLSFDGSSSSDLDGTIVRYFWEVVGTLQNSSSVSATFNFTTAGNYIVRLTVTDDFGATGTDEVIVDVSPPDNILPVAILNSLNNKLDGFVNDVFIFNPNGSFDSDGNIIYYDLSYSDGTTKRFYFTFQDTKVFTAAGQYKVSLKATDNSNATSLDTSLSSLNINIKKRQADSSFTFDKINPYTLENITFTNTSNDPDNSIVKWVWNFDDGTIVEAFTKETANQIKQYSLGNKFYNVTLTTVDEYGNQYINTQTIYVLNRKPIAIISSVPQAVNNIISGEAPLSIFFDSNGYDPDDNGLTNYEWEIVGLSQTTITSKSFTYVFNNPSNVNYEVKHRVKDGLGDFSDYASVFVNVKQANRPPVVFVRASPRSNTALAPVTVSFSSSGTYDPDNPNEVLSYEWDFGNGFTSTLANPQTTYSKPGDYNVSLKVTDSKGASTTAKTFFDGSPLVYKVLNNRPVAALDTVPSGIVQVEINKSLDFTSLGSFDPDTDQYIASYKWLLDNIELPQKTQNVNIIFTSLGLHRVSLYVYDNIGLESLETFLLINVIDVPPQINLNPVAILTNEPSITGYIEINEGDTISFDGISSYDPEDITVTRFEWIINGIVVGNQPVLPQTFNTAGIYNVLLNVYDSKDLSSTPETNKGFRFSVDVRVSKITNTTNNILSTGYNFDGQLALSDTSNRSEFTLINNTEKWVSISAGHSHSLFLDQNGNLYCSGSNAFGQLGLGSGVANSSSLRKVTLPLNYKVLLISAGFNKSAIVVLDSLNNKKLLLVCGDNSDSGLGDNLPKSNVYAFSTVLEFENTADSLYYLECEKLVAVLHKGYILSTKTALKFIELYDQGINYNGYKILRVAKNPDKFSSQLKLYITKIEVFDNYIAGIGLDNLGFSIWYFGTSNLRGYGYAKDIGISSFGIYVIILDQDTTLNKALFAYDLNLNFTKGYVTNYNTSPATSTFAKISVVDNHYLALDDESNLWVSGSNDLGQLGLGSVRQFSWSEQDYSRLPPLQRKQSDGNFGLELYSSTYKVIDISAGTNHSIIINGTGIPSSGNGSGSKYDFPYPQDLFNYPTIIDITLQE